MVLRILRWIPKFIPKWKDAFDKLQKDMGFFSIYLFYIMFMPNIFYTNSDYCQKYLICT
jgi:hypothetical protein